MVDYFDFEKPIEDITKKIETLDNSEPKNQNLINNYIKEKDDKDQPVVWGILTQCVCALNAFSMIAILYDVFFN